MDERPPPWWRGPTRWPVAAVTALVVLVTVLALALNPGTRGLARAFVVNGWRLPVGGEPDGDGGRTDEAASDDPVRRQAEQTPPPTLHWAPSADSDWQWLPAGSPDLGHPVDVYDIPLAGADPAMVTDVHDHGAHAVCWLPIGIVSTTDPARNQLAHTMLGKPVPGHPDERYLDIRRVDDLKPYLAARLDDCWTKGFDGVDAAALDTYFTAGADGTGFPLTYADGLALTTAVAGLAHGRGLAVGVHAGVTATSRDEFVQAVEPITDFAVVERCAVPGQSCGAFAPYTRHGKAVLHVEYLQDHPGATAAGAQVALTRLCPTIRPLGYRTILKDGSGANPAWRLACP